MSLVWLDVIRTTGLILYLCVLIPSGSWGLSGFVIPITLIYLSARAIAELFCWNKGWAFEDFAGTSSQRLLPCKLSDPCFAYA